MRIHLVTVHGVKELVFRCPTVREGGEYDMSVRMKGDMKYASCPVDGCSGGACDSFGMFQHFV